MARLRDLVTTGGLSLEGHLSEVHMSFSIQSYNLVDVVNDHSRRLAFLVAQTVDHRGTVCQTR